MPRRRRSRPRRDAGLAVTTTTTSSCYNSDDEDSSCGGRGGGGGGEKPQQRNAANARERARMRVLSKAFCRLKTTLPWVPADTKLSKLDTLRLATSYIAHLRAIMNEEAPVHPLNLTWPFSFQQQSLQQQPPAQQHQRASYDNVVDLHELQENTSSSCPDGLDEESNLGPLHQHHQHHLYLGNAAPHQHQFSDALLHIG